jgi:hypothetical protein
MRKNVESYRPDSKGRKCAITIHLVTTYMVRIPGQVEIRESGCKRQLKTRNHNRVEMRTGLSKKGRKSIDIDREVSYGKGRE